MRELLDQKLARFEELEKQLLDPAVQASGPQMAAVLREHGNRWPNWPPVPAVQGPERANIRSPLVARG